MQNIIRIQSKEEFLKIKDNYNSHQYFSYICEQCGQIYQKPKWKLKKDNWIFLCRDCSFKFKYTKTWFSKSKEERIKIKEKRKQTSLNHWGVENPMQSKKIIQTLKENNLQKYGVDSFSKTKEFKKLCEETWKNKSKEEIKNMIKKIQQTSLEKYGTGNAMQTLFFKEKLKQNNLQKYGVGCTLQLKDVKEKSKQTCLEKYGVENYSQTKESQYNRKSRYFYDNQSFDSCPEICFYIYCKDFNLNIKRCLKSFEYVFEGKEYYYFPDFEIDGKYYEIKGNQFLTENGKWQNPFNHSLDKKYEAKHQCALKNNVIILYEKDYQKYIEYVEEKYGRNYLNQFKN